MESLNVILMEPPILSSSSKGKDIEVIGVAAPIENLEVSNSSFRVEEVYSTLESVSGVDLSLLADEDLSGSWWARYDPPKELIWTDKERCSLGESSFEDWLDGVLRTLRDEVAVEESINPTAAVTTNIGSWLRKPDYGDLAPEVFVDAIEVLSPLQPETSRHRPQISVNSELSDTRGAVELESPTSPSSSTDTRSLSGSIFSSSSKGSKRRSGVKQEFITVGSLAYSPYTYFSHLPPRDQTVVPMPVSPRAEQIRRFLSKRKSESECSSCMDDHKDRKLVTLACQHKYCRRCLETLVKTAIQDESLWPPRCCIQDIPLKTIKGALSRKDYQAYSQKAKEYATPPDRRIYCPQPSCSAWIPPTTAIKVSCPRCKAAVCKTCQGAAHPAQDDCPEDFALQATLQEGERRGWRRCFQCRTLVERSSGCEHMTCNCGAEFCYICGALWKTCACKDEENQNYQEVQNLPEDAHEQEEAEVRAAVAATEAMIRREEEERIRRENALRIAAEHRVREEARQRERLAEQERAMEEEWSRIVKAKYDHLRKDIDNLYRKQWEMLSERHWHEREKLAADRMMCEAESQRKLAADTMFLEERRENELGEQRILLQQEREQLDNQQVADEDEYWFGLQSHLKGRSNREERQRVLMERFNATQAEQMNNLHQQQQNKLTEFTIRFEAQLAQLKSDMTRVREVNMQTELIKMKDLARHQYADTKWFEATRAARDKKQQEMEEVAKSNEEEKRKALLGWKSVPVAKN